MCNHTQLQPVCVCDNTAPEISCLAGKDYRGWGWGNVFKEQGMVEIEQGGLMTLINGV